MACGSGAASCWIPVTFLPVLKAQRYCIAIEPQQMHHLLQLSNYGPSEELKRNTQVNNNGRPREEESQITSSKAGLRCSVMENYSFLQCWADSFLPALNLPFKITQTMWFGTGWAQKEKENHIQSDEGKLPCSTKEASSLNLRDGARKEATDSRKDEGGRGYVGGELHWAYMCEGKPSIWEKPSGAGFCIASAF